MIQSTKWYGLKAKTPEEYFNNSCHSYQDISNLLDKKGIDIIRDIKPSLENFIHNSSDIMPDELYENLIISDDFTASCIATEAVIDAINNIDKIALSKDDSAWFLWSNIPAINVSFTLGRVNESAIDILSTALEACAQKVAENHLSLETLKHTNVVENFNNFVSFKDMMNWDSVRESVMQDDPMVAHLGDLIHDLQPEEIHEIAMEGKMSEIDLSLSEIAEELKYKNPAVKGSSEGYRSLVDDIWMQVRDADESTIDTCVEDAYFSRKMTISVESYIGAITRMVKEGCVPDVKDFSKDRADALVRLLKGEPATEGLYVNIKNHEYNMELWQRRAGMNILWVTGFAGSGKSTFSRNLGVKTENCIVIESDKFIMNTHNTYKYGDNSLSSQTLDKFLSDNTDLPTYEEGNYNNEMIIVKRFMNWIQKEANSHPKTLYIVEGVWMMYDVEPSFFKGKPLVVIGTSAKNSLKQRSFRDGNGYKSARNKYYYKSQDIYRQKLISVMSDGATESMFLMDINLIDNDGMISGIESTIRDLEMMSFDYIPESLTVSDLKQDDDKEKDKDDDDKDSDDDKEENTTSTKLVQKSSEKRKLVNKVREKVTKGSIGVTKAYNQYKLHEDDIDTKLTDAIKKCARVVFGSSTASRDQLIEGKDYSVVNTLKLILGGYAVFSVSKVAFFLILIVRWCNGGKIKRHERKRIIEELEAELEVLDNKISDARYNNEKDAVYALIRTKHNVQSAIKRLKSKDTAERASGMGYRRRF